ncbi:MAG TPA: DUF2510 domain-containing protein [Acidimicrobiales bacterium]|nr:DUF2510 domain-containing protein [Acidimicrobiales bacterium]
MRYGYVGNGSWMVGLAFFAVILFRVLASNRARAQRRPPPTGASPLVGQARPPGPPAPSGPPSPTAHRQGPKAGSIGSAGVAAGWLIDPTGRHELRYWSGTEWTSHVSDGGVPGTDDPPSHQAADPT